MSISLRAFAIANLGRPSPSTNPMHRRLMAYTALNAASVRLTNEQYKKCQDFIAADFDTSVFEDTDEDVQVADELSEAVCS